MNGGTGALVASAQESAPAGVAPLRDVLVDANHDSVPDRLGDEVTIRGVITSDPLAIGRGAFMAMLQDVTGGVALFTREAPRLMARAQRGDLVEVRGRVAQYRGAEQIQIGELHRVGAGELPEPRHVLAADLLEGRFQGQLVHVSGRLDASASDLAGGGVVALIDRSGTLPVVITERLLEDRGLAERLLKRGWIEIVGIATQSDSAAPFDSGYRLIPRDPSDFTVHTEPPYRTIAAAGAVVLVAALIFDLSRRRRVAERHARAMTELSEAAHASEERYREAFHEALAGNYVSRPDGTIVTCNEAFARILGFASAAEAIRSNARVLYADLEERERFVERLRTEGRIPPCQVVLRHRSGTPVYASETAIGKFDADGNLVEIRGYLLDMTERQRAEEAVARLAESYRSLIRGAAYGIYRATLDGRFLDVNPALAAMLGYSADELLEINVRDVFRQPEEHDRLVERCRRTQQTETIEVRWARKDRSEMTARLSGRAVRDEGGRPAAMEMMVEDVSERRILEEQLRQAQKMEAVGRLAGGVAHDFNNLMTAVLGYSELLLSEMPSGDERREPVEQIRAAGERATGLTRQLLAFSRKQVLQPSVIDLNAVVTNIEDMLRRLIGEDVELLTVLPPGLDPVCADAGQIEQVIMNLAVNARDAMPRGGMLTIETSRLEVDTAFARMHPVMTPGRYTVLAVSDTGVGMPPEVQKRLFEPFFTTKEQGKGTGLGLAMVYGIVRQSGGHIWVYSEPGHGSTFKIYLPAVEALVPEAPVTTPEAASGHGRETVLLAEDETSVRNLTARVLRRFGYHVLDVESATAALELATSHDGPIDLLLTDVVMPGLRGSELAEAVTRLRPGVRVLFMSGYTEMGVVHQGQLDPAVPFLQKPFTPDRLARKVREVLDEPQPLSSAGL